MDKEKKGLHRTKMLLRIKTIFISSFLLDKETSGVSGKDIFVRNCTSC